MRACSRQSAVSSRQFKNCLGSFPVIRFLPVFFLFLIFHLSFINAAFCAEGAAHGGDWKEWLWKILNFAILVFILVKFLGKPLSEFLKKRTELIEKTLREAKEAREFAERALAEAEERLKLKDREIEDILEQSRRSAVIEQEHLIKQGEQMKEKIIEQAKNNINLELRLAKEAIKAEAVEIAAELAEKKIKSRITTDKQAGLIEESISMIEGRN